MSYTKYKYYKKQIKSGSTWVDAYPIVYTLSGEPSGYYQTLDECEASIEPTYEFKFSGRTTGGNELIPCDDDPTYSFYYNSYPPIIAYIGECVEEFQECNSCSQRMLQEIHFSDDVNIRRWALRNYPYLTDVHLPKNLTSIPDSCFSGSYNLSNLTIPSGVTSIGQYAFKGCNSLSSLTLPDGITSIGMNAFDKCTGLTSINLPSGLTVINRALFSGCTSLSSITIPESVTYISDSAFYNCSSLSSVTIPSGSGIGSDAFRGCTQLQTVNGDLINVGSTAFYECTNLTGGITIKGNYVSPGAFSYCTSLSSITFSPNINIIFGDSFYGCSGLTSITVEREIPPTLYNRAFDYTNNCPIYVPCGSLDAYRTASGWTAYADRIYCDSTKFIATYSDSTTYSPQCNSHAVTSADTKGYTKALSSMTSISFGECVNNIGDYAFSGATSLTSVTIPNSVTSIGEDAFNECTSLSNITIPSGVTKISDATFKNCSGLTSITISDSITSIGAAAFWGCSTLSGITIPSGVTSIGTRAFTDSTGLTSVTVNATRPPILGNYVFDNTNNCPIYVPSGSISSYLDASGWSAYASRIQAIT